MWLNSLKNYDIHKNTKFLKTSYLKPLNTCKKHFQTILLNFPLDSVKFKESTQWYNIFYIAKAIATVVYSQKVTTNRDQFQ